MKKSKIILSCASIFCAIGIIVGGTYSLLHKTSEVDVEVKSGAINLTSSVEELKLYSADYSYTEGEEIPSSLEELGTTYYYKPVESFINGGTASLNGSKLSINAMTPGDKIEASFKINKNDTNINFKYRFVMKSMDSSFGALKLFSNLKVSAFDETLTNKKQYFTPWVEYDLNDESIVKEIKIEYPINLINDIGVSSCNIKFGVEAVQLNAYTTNEDDFYLSLTDKEVIDDDGELVDMTIDSALNNSNIPLVQLVVPCKDGGLVAGEAERDIVSGDLLTLKVENCDEGNIELVGNRSICYDVTLLDQNGEKVALSSGNFEVKIYLGLGASINGVYHNGVAVDELDYNYDESTGYLTLVTDSLSPFVVDLNCSHDKYVLASQTNTVNTYRCESCGTTKEVNRIERLVKDEGIEAEVITTNNGYYNPSMISYGLFEVLDYGTSLMGFINDGSLPGGQFWVGTIPLTKGKTYQNEINVKNTGDVKFSYSVTLDPVLVNGVDISEHISFELYVAGGQRDLANGESNKLRLKIGVKNTLPDEFVGLNVDNICVELTLTAVE